MRKATSATLVAPATAIIRKYKIYANAVDKILNPPNAAHVWMLGAGNVHGLSIHNINGKIMIEEHVVCPAAMESGDTPHLRNRSP